ncbi:NADAR family protein [Phanerochaete sordida]|uniref:NADAR family protein n=1 Tax=Phanerochaete sordida TaxID=48140 RepID=A0A9P3GIY0_9APHY|nr:NADAR family protein [Phanerochaete sordida]
MNNRTSTSQQFAQRDQQERDWREGPQAGQDRKKGEAGLGEARPALTPAKSEGATKGRDNTTLFFYERDKPYYEFTNFALFDVEYQGKVYPTSEHLFQARKFLETRPELAEQIRTTPNSRQALDQATRLRKLQRSDWFSVNISVMEEVVYLKFTQHPRLRSLLLGTNDRELVEASPVDAFWGYGSDRKGRNELGNALMRIRKRLREERMTPAGPPSIGTRPSGPSRTPPVAPPRSLPAIPGMKQMGANIAKYFAPPLPPRPGDAAVGDLIKLNDESLAKPIFFAHEGEYAEFVNMSPHSVTYEGKMYATAEHLYQAYKFVGSSSPQLADHIRCQPTATSACEAANSLIRQRRHDWLDVRLSIMDTVVEAKFTQHLALRMMLLSTGDRQLVYANDVDAYWGVGPNATGQNEFGKILMRTRDMFRARAQADGGVGADCRSESTAPGSRQSSTRTVASSPSPSCTPSTK